MATTTTTAASALTANAPVPGSPAATITRRSAPAISARSPLHGSPPLATVTRRSSARLAAAPVAAPPVIPAAPAGGGIPAVVPPVVPPPGVPHGGGGGGGVPPPGGGGAALSPPAIGAPGIAFALTPALKAAWTITSGIGLGLATDLFDDFGQLSLDALTDHASHYVFTHTRDAQNSHQFYQCLYDSLTPDAFIRVCTRKDEFTVSDANNNEVTEGCLFFNVITQCAQVDTVATVNALLLKMTCLDSLMIRLDSNIQSFDTETHAIQQRLLGRGTCIPDTQLMVNLFRGYMACTDKTFTDYIKGLRDGYEDNSRPCTPPELMHFALNKYTISDAGEWKATTEHDKKIVALEATVTELQGHLKKQPATKEKEADKGAEKGAKAKRKYPAWKSVAPATGESHEKTVNRKKLHWCPHHKLWVAHKPSDCRLQTSPTSDGATPPLQSAT